MNEDDGDEAFISFFAKSQAEQLFLMAHRLSKMLDLCLGLSIQTGRIQAVNPGWEGKERYG